MNFLAPLFLAGAAAIALPVIFHLIRRSTRERTVFSSLMFLKPSPPQLSRRSRLQDLLLLLLRCAALVLLAFGFSRPFLRQAFPESQTGPGAKRTVILLDTSASMRRQDLWERARARVDEILRQSKPNDEVALFTFDRSLQPLLTFEQWNATAAGDRVALALNRLAAANPGWFSTQLDTAVIRSAELLGDADKRSPRGTREIVIVTDLQEGSQTRALQAYEWPKGIAVITERVGAKTGNNAGLQLVTEAAEAAYGTETIVRLRLSNAADSKREQLQVGWASESGTYLQKPLEVYVPAGQSRVVSLPLPGTNSVAERILLSGDDDPFDNTIFVVPPERSRTTVVYLGDDDPTDNRQPSFFLHRALQETRGQSLQVVDHKTSSLLTPVEVQGAGLIVATGPLANPQATSLRNAVRDGKTLLFAPTTVAAASTLGTVLGLGPVTSSEAPTNGYAMLGEIAFDHALFAAFADARFSDFTKIHFWRHRRLDLAPIPEARVLAAFDSGDPAIFQVPLGKGRVIIFTSGWHPSDSQLALSSKFVPLLYSLLELSAPAPASPQQRFAGSPVNLSSGVDAPTAVVLPDGTRQALSAGTTNFEGTTLPGLYSVVSSVAPRRFAVNIDPSESRTTPLPADELERLGVPPPRVAPLASTELERKTRLQNNELESQQKLWRWFIIATLGVLGFETLLAGMTARRVAPVEAGAT
jgi:hypothetical protein